MRRALPGDRDDALVYVGIGWLSDGRDNQRERQAPSQNGGVFHAQIIFSKLRFGKPENASRSANDRDTQLALVTTADWVGSLSD